MKSSPKFNKSIKTMRSLLFITLLYIPFIGNGQICDIDGVSPGEHHFPTSGGNLTVQVFTVGTSCDIEVGMYPPWVSITKLSSNQFRITASANTGSMRMSHVTFFTSSGGTNVENAMISITQEAGGAFISLSKLGISFSSSGGNNTFRITSSISYTISNNMSWLSCSSSSGSGNKTITLSCNAATSASLSSGTIIVSGGGITRTIFVSRAGLALDPGSIGGVQTICPGTAASTLSNTSSASGCSGISYQWQYSYNNSTWYNISGATGLTYSPGEVSQTCYYRREANSNECDSEYTGSVKVTVKEIDNPSLLTLENASQTINYGGNPSSISLASPSPFFYYQWFESTNPIDFDFNGIPDLNDCVPIWGATTSSYDPPSLTQSRYYVLRVEVEFEGCYYYTMQASVTVCPQFNAGTLSGNLEGICYNTEPDTINFITPPDGGCSSNYSYQWSYRDEDITTWTNIFGATSNSYYEALNHLTQAREYRVAVSSGGSTKYAYTIVFVYDQLIGGTITGSSSVMSGQLPGTITSSANPSGGAGGHSYQWQKKEGSASWQDISGATSLSYTPGVLTTTTSFRRRVNDSECARAYSNEHTVKVEVEVLIADPENLSFCATGGSKPLNVSGNWPSSSLTIGSQPTWLNYDMATGTVSCQSNQTGGDLSGEIIVNGQTKNINIPVTLLRQRAFTSSETTVSILGTTKTVYVSYEGNGWHVDQSILPSWINVTQHNTGTSDAYYKELHAYESSEEVKRNQIILKPGFNTTGQTEFHAHINSELALDENASHIKISAEPNTGEVGRSGNVTLLSDDECASHAITVNQLIDGKFDMNYIRTFVASHNNEGETTEPTHENIDYEKWSESIQYFDGLGRGIQQVAVKASPAGSDIIKPIVYDDYGRQKIDYLAYAINQDGRNTQGAYRSDAENEIKTYYNTFYGSTDGDYPFAEKEFDNSPLNRVMKQGAPGAAWQLTGGNPVSFEYATNTAEEVGLYKVDANGSLNKNGSYNAASLYKNTITDENGNITTEYKDKQGQVVMKKAGANQTHYVYDDFGLLRYVISPKASTALNAQSGNIGNSNDNQTIKDLCYYYEYDSRKRMALKKLPGAEPVYMVYNKRDQLVLTQDGNLRNDNDWLFTKYDVLNRPVIIGKYHHTSSINQTDMQTEVNTNSVYFENTSLTEEHGYTNKAFPTTATQTYSVMYYDNYDYIKQLSSYNLLYKHKADEIDFIYPQTDTVKGQQTAVKTMVLNNDNIAPLTDTVLISVMYYDEYYRLIQTISDNHLGGLDITSNQINFAGELLLTKQNHQTPNDTAIIQQILEYDHASRLIATKHLINEQDTVVLNQLTYDELGLLKEKALHGDGSGFAQEVNHNYNIRGWLTGINNADNLGDDLFAMKLDYNNGSNPQHNGNIAAIDWVSKDQSLSQYDFTYDNINRLTAATYAGTGDHNTTYAYDANGNITNLIRNGQISDSTYGIIDNLTYDYDGTNQLQSVNDQTASQYQANGFSDNASFGSAEYTYDVNGNMIGDLNKSLSVAQYNNLNLPQQINISNNNASNEINYIYNAAGVKLHKQTKTDHNIGKTTDYVGNIIYEDNEIKYILTGEGRLLPKGDGTYEYQYYLKDHLGNTRILFDENNAVLQNDSYYPFGMTMKGLAYTSATTAKNNYLYNGKELQNDFELDWYDYGARFYDAQIGRWHVMDPLMEKYLNISPYAYAGNNPINIIDPDGMDWYDIDGAITWKDQEGKYKQGDNTYNSLGKNVVVITHNRNEDGETEEMNTATFSLYLEDNTEGATATIKGNSVPDDPEKSGTLAEGVYPAEAQSRASYKKRGKTDLAIIINGGNEVPTVNGNPSKKNSDMLTGVFIHMGNNYSSSLHDSKGNAYSHGCQTGGNYSGSHAVYNKWRSNAPNFKGNLYLRAIPVKASTANPINNTSTKPSLYQQLKTTFNQAVSAIKNIIN